MSKELELIAHALADAADDGCFDNPPTFHEDGLPDLDVDLDGWHSGGEDRVYWMKLARASVSVLAASGHTIVSNAQVREMIGPSREVDRCPKCGETAEWEKNAYDLRDNDDHRYSWVAYCEVCKLDLELMPWPNPPIAAAAAAEEGTNG